MEIWRLTSDGYVQVRDYSKTRLYLRGFLLKVISAVVDSIIFRLQKKA